MDIYSASYGDIDGIDCAEIKTFKPQSITHIGAEAWIYLQHLQSGAI